jgi:subtilase family serine protease
MMVAPTEVRYMHIPGRIGATGLAAATLIGMAVGMSGAAAAAQSSRTQLPGSVPTWARAVAAHGSAAGTDNVGFRVYLGWRGGDAAARLASSVSTPGSPDYRHFLTAAQFRQQFAPAQADVGAVQQWLRGSGFTVDYTPSNNHYVAAEGTVAQANQALGVTLTNYSVQGLTLRAPDRPLSVPSALGSIVAGVVGLDDSAALLHYDHADAPPAGAFVNAPPCSAYWAEKSTATTPGADGTAIPTAYGSFQPWAPCGYTPSQLQGGYGVASAIAGGTNGAGQTVGIIDAYASPTILQDVNEYSSRHGLPQLTGGQFRQIVAPGTFRRPQNPAQDPQGWYGEESLDVEAVHSMAPGANIVYVGAPNNYQDLDAALNHVVDDQLATIVTNSYGFSTEALPFGYIKPYNDTFIQAAATGIGVYFSSGDSGDETNGVQGARPTPDWPASSPWVTAVGGTSLAVGAANDYEFETGWQTGNSALAGGAWSPTPPGSYLYGAGGGTSRLFAQPAYQAGVVPDSIARTYGGAAMRVVPDIAALGDPNTGMLIGLTQTFPDGSARYGEYRIGGTSLSSPLTAGLMALVQQRAGHRLGFMNPTIYANAGSGAYHDVVPPAGPLAVVRANYVNGVDATDGYAYFLRSLSFDAPLTIHTRPGYDDITGVGTPDGAAFLTALSQ